MAAPGWATLTNVTTVIGSRNQALLAYADEIRTTFHNPSRELHPPLPPRKPHNMAAMEQVFDIPELLEAILVHLGSNDLFRLVCVKKTWHTSILNSIRLRRIMFLAQDNTSEIIWNPALHRHHPELRIKASTVSVHKSPSPDEIWLYVEVSERDGQIGATRPSRHDVSKVLSTSVWQAPVASMVLHMDFRRAGGGFSCARLDGNPKLRDLMHEVEEAHADFALERAWAQAQQAQSASIERTASQ